MSSTIGVEQGMLHLAHPCSIPYTTADESAKSYSRRRDIESQQNRNLRHSIAPHCAEKLSPIFTVFGDYRKTMICFIARRPCIAQAQNLDLHKWRCFNRQFEAWWKSYEFMILRAGVPQKVRQLTIQDYGNYHYSWDVLQFWLVMLCWGILKK